MTGHSYHAGGDEFVLADSNYGDNTAILFNERGSAESGISHIMRHFEKFGMEVYIVEIEKITRAQSLNCCSVLSLYICTKTKTLLIILI